MKSQKLLLIFGLILSLGFTILMIMRLTTHWGTLHNKRGDPSIAPWMSIPHVARNYGIPPKDLADLLNLPAPQRDNVKRTTLGDIAKSRNQTFDQFKTELRTLITEYKQTHTANPTPPPDVPTESP